MGSFAERVDRFRERRDDNLRKIINQAARVMPSTEAEATERKIIAEADFKNLGLYDFLVSARDFIKSRDGHSDAKLVLDRYDPKLDYKTAQRRFLSAEQRLLLSLGFSPDEVINPKKLEMISEKIKFSAIAELRWNFVYGRVANGYSFVRVQYFPVGGVVEVTGSEQQLVFAIPDSTEEIESAIVNAYHNPGKQQPINEHPEGIIE